MRNQLAEDAYNTNEEGKGKKKEAKDGKKNKMEIVKQTD